MSNCVVRLVPRDNQGDPINIPGRWFLIETPAGYYGMGVSCDSSNWVYWSDNADPTLPIDNNCTDKHDIYITWLYAIGDYRFRFVPSLEEDATICGQDCFNCVDVIVHVLLPDVGNGAVQMCQGEFPLSNLYDLAGLPCANYNIGYAPGSDQDSDFILTGDCSVRGNFISADISVGTYTFEFTPSNYETDCDECTVLFTVIITEGFSGGSDQEAIICQPVRL